MFNEYIKMHKASIPYTFKTSASALKGKRLAHLIIFDSFLLFSFLRIKKMDRQKSELKAKQQQVFAGES